MKKLILIIVLAMASTIGYCQSKTSIAVKNNFITPKTDSVLTLDREHATILYKLLEYSKEAVSTTTSKNITVADATAILTGIANMQKVIQEKFAPKQASK